MPFVEIQFKDIFFNPEVQKMCVSRTFTCPNYNHSWSCPPAAPYLEQEISTYKKFFLIYSKFDLESYVKEIKLKHPRRSEQKIKNNYYMKSVYRNDLGKEIEKFLKQYQEPHEKKLILHVGACTVCNNKNDGKCTYDSGEPCRYPEKRRYSMEAVGIEVIKTVMNLKADIEYPSHKYSYQFGLACFK
ncbi:MAG: DUF2284 domain-containing protein [Promethearchaeota archaeon]|nr:MAG: DUF2284 domain-containing protein [Candidatus Lokiarchaeota archaeon]